MKEALEAAFARAAAAGHDEERLLVAGRRVLLRAAGRELAAAVVRPFHHLREAWSGAAELTVEVWDGAATGVSCPLPPAALARPGVSVAGDVVSFLGPGSATALDRAAGRIVGWRADARALSLEERMKPLPLALELWLLDRGICSGHAAFVARAGVGVLLAGASGAGKSTAALACAASGLDFLGEDRVGIERTGDGSFAGHGLYASAWLERDHLQRHPWLACGAPVEQGADKDAVFLADTGRAVVARRAAIAAVVLPRRGEPGPPRLLPAGRADAVRALAPVSLAGVAAVAAPWILEQLRALVSSVPVLAAEDAGSPASLAELVARVLAGDLRASPPPGS